MGNVTTTDITAINNSSTVTKINTNTHTLRDEFDKVVYKDGREEMTANLDMNTKRILNLSDAESLTEPVTLRQLSAIVAGTAGVTSAEVAAEAALRIAGDSARPTNSTLASASGAASIGTAAGGTVQDFINAMLVNTFASIATFTIHASISTIEVGDRAGAKFRRVSAAVAGPLPAKAKTQDGSGQWWAISFDQVITPYHLGLIGEPWETYGGADESTTIQQFWDLVCNNEVNADATCSAMFLTALNLYPTTGNWKTRTLKGVMRLRAGGYITGRAQIIIDNFPEHLYWDGGIVHFAFGGLDFSIRNSPVGIGLGQLSRGRIGLLVSKYNQCHGIIVGVVPGSDNSNLLIVDRMVGSINGCGYDIVNTTFESTVATVTQFGADGSQDQRSKLTFSDAIIPVGFDLYVGNLGTAAASGSVVRTDQIMMKIAGRNQLYKVCHIDRSTGAVTLFPKVPTALAVGTKIRWLAGSGVKFEGGDSNLVNVHIMEGALNGVSAIFNALYNGTVGHFHCDAVGVGFSVGGYTGAVCEALLIGNSYFEGVSYADIVVGSNGVDGAVEMMTVGGAIPNVRDTIDPSADAAGNRINYYPAIGGLRMIHQNIEYKDHGNVFRYVNTLNWYLGRENPQRMLANGTPSVVLRLNDPEYVRITGNRGGQLFLRGTGAAGALGAAPLFDAFTVGETVNGAATWTAPDASAGLFDICYDPEAVPPNWLVQKA